MLFFSCALAAAGKLLPLLVMRFARALNVLRVVAAAVTAMTFVLQRS